jgi:type II secretory pathway component PulF
MRFKYKAKKGPSDTVEGFVEAASREEVLSFLSDQGLYPVSVVEAGSAPLKGTPAEKSKKIVVQKHVTTADIIIFTRQLWSLTKAKLELLQALGLLYEQIEKPALKDLVSEVYSKVREGQNFAEALLKYPRYFSPVYVSMVKSGETSGNLEEALFRITEYLEARQELQLKIKTACVYPSFILLVGILSIFVLIIFVIPKLSVIFEDLGSNLPLVTRVLIGFSKFLSKSWLLFFGPLGIGLFWLFTSGKRFIGKIFMKTSPFIPFIGKVLYEEKLVRFAQTMALLLKSRVSILESLTVAAGVVSNKTMETKIKEAAFQVSQGVKITQSLDNVVKLPKFFIKMLGVGEESGRLEESFYEVADFYSKELDTKIKVLTSVLEPVIILGIGLILGVIILSVMLPIFQMNQLLK